MNSKEYFIKCCEKNGIEYEAYFSLSHSNSGKKERYECRNNYLFRKSSQQYVIKCLNDQDLYLAWKLDTRGAHMKNVFSILRRDVKVNDNSVCVAKKYIESKWKEEEKVYCFNKTGVDEFLQKYVDVNK